MYRFATRTVFIQTAIRKRTWNTADNGRYSVSRGAARSKESGFLQIGYYALSSIESERRSAYEDAYVYRQGQNEQG